MSNRIKLPKRKTITHEKVKGQKQKHLNKVVTFKREAAPSMNVQPERKRGLFKRRKK